MPDDTGLIMRFLYNLSQTASPLRRKFAELPPGASDFRPGLSVGRVEA